MALPSVESIYEVAWLSLFLALRIAGVAMAWVLHLKPYEERMDGTERATGELAELGQLGSTVASAVGGLLNLSDTNATAPSEGGAGAGADISTANHTLLLLLSGVYGVVVLVDVLMVGYRLNHRFQRLTLFEREKAGEDLTDQERAELDVRANALKKWFQSAALVVRLFRIPILFSYVAISGRYQQADFYYLFALIPTFELVVSLAVYMYFYSFRWDAADLGVRRSRGSSSFASARDTREGTPIPMLAMAHSAVADQER
jgi:hypothetical protein